MSLFQRMVNAAQALAGYKKPTGPSLMPDFPEWAKGQPWALNAVQLDVPNAIRRVGTIYACVTRVAEDFSGLPRVFELESKPGEYEPIERQPDSVVDIWQKANSQQSALELLRDLGAHFKSAGNAYLVLDTYGLRRPSSRAWELWSAVPHEVEVVMGDGRKPLAYVFNRRGTRERIDAENVVHFKGFTPDDEPRGMSPLEAVEFQYGNRYNLGRIIDAFLKSGGVLPGYWYVPEGTDPASAASALSSKQQEAMLEALKSRQGVTSWFKPFLAGLMQRKDAGTSFRDMMLVELVASSDADICRAMGVPPWLVGIKQGETALAGQAGPSADLAIYWNNTVKPMADLFDAVMTERFCPRFGDKIRVRTDFSGVIPMQMERLAQADKLKSLSGRAVLTVNEARAMMGQPPVDDPEADMLYVQASPFSAPGGMDSPTSGGDAKPAADAQPLQKTRSADGDADEAKAKRDQRKKQHAVRLAQYERAFARAFAARVLAPQERRVIAALTDGGRALAMRTLAIDGAMLTDPEDEEAIRRIFEELLIARGEEALAQIAAEVDMIVAGGRAAQWIKDRTAKCLANTSATTTEALRLSLAEGAANGEDLGQLIARVRDVFNDRRSNAITIARTEMGGAYNYAAVEAWQQSGIVDKVEWLTAHDSVVRESHAAADGQQVDMGSPFMVGGYALSHPGDTSGPAEEVINCRCTVDPVVNERKRTAMAFRKWWPSKNGHRSHSPVKVAN